MHFTLKDKKCEMQEVITSEPLIKQLAPLVLLKRRKFNIKHSTNQIIYLLQNNKELER